MGKKLYRNCSDGSEFLLLFSLIEAGQDNQAERVKEL
jgi:hypothetical protein